MCPAADLWDEPTRHPGLLPRATRVATTVLAVAALLFGGYIALQAKSGGASQAEAAEPAVDDQVELPVVVSTTTTPSTTAATTTTTTVAMTTTSMAPPAAPPTTTYDVRYVVPLTEAEPEAKQLAADIAYALTTYGVADDHAVRLEALGSRSGIDLLTVASQPLIFPDSWSRGEVIYPQLGGLKNDRASVMVVTRQTVGSGGEVAFSVVRTLDIRLIRGESGWEFDALNSAGGTFDRLEDLALAHEVARDPRIQMPDSARIDIISGLVSPVLLGVMAELADQTTYSITVLATGHPHNVFETDRQSDHTAGLAVDIDRIGGVRVIDDRLPDSVTRTLVEWLLDHPEVRQVGGPWDLDGSESRRSFTDPVHQDHIHLAVNP